LVRLYVPVERLGDAQVDLLPDEIGYLTRVRRLSVGDAVEVFDGRGGRWPGALQPGKGRLSLGARVQDGVRRRFSFELWQGLPKGDRMEWVIQKATELGVSRIVPLACERSVVKLTPTRAIARLQRWRKIAQEAARQSGRADVPEVAEVATLSTLTGWSRAGRQAALMYEREDRRALRPFLEGIAMGSHIALVVGPEGGFDAAEVERVSAAGIPLLGLGDRMLRTETAAVAVCVLALEASGGMGGLPE
jgi:16S rRNA (uracil1498-N3)-methyltransferase